MQTETPNCRVVQAGWDSRRSRAQPPAQSQVFCEIRPGFSGLHPAGSWKLPRMETPNLSGYPYCSTVLMVEKLFLLSHWNFCHSSWSDSYPTPSLRLFIQTPVTRDQVSSVHFQEQAANEEHAMSPTPSTAALLTPFTLKVQTALQYPWKFRPYSMHLKISYCEKKLQGTDDHWKH